VFEMGYLNLRIESFYAKDILSSSYLKNDDLLHFRLLI
jgi:hypothetical protein